jgi:glutaredoxin
MLAMLVPFLLLCGAAVWLKVTAALPLIAGAFIGAVAAEIGHQRRYISWWPLNREITDWQKVDQLLGGTAEIPALAATTARVPHTRLARAVIVGVSVFAVIFGGTLAADRALAYAHDPTRDNPADGVILLTASWCGYCMSLRHHLTEMNIHYTELDVEKTTEGGWAFAADHGTGIPITVVGNQVIRGVAREGSQWQRVDDALKKAGYTLAPIDERDRFMSSLNP